MFSPAGGANLSWGILETGNVDTENISPRRPPTDYIIQLCALQNSNGANGAVPIMAAEYRESVDCFTTVYRNMQPTRASCACPCHPSGQAQDKRGYAGKVTMDACLRRNDPASRAGQAPGGFLFLQE